MIPIKLTKKTKSKLSLTNIELESNEFNDLDIPYTYPLTNSKDIYDDLNFDSTNNLEIIGNLKTENKIYHEIELQEKNDINDINDKNNEDKISNSAQLYINSNSFVNKNEKKLIKKRKRMGEKKEKSPIDYKIDDDKLYLNKNYNIIINGKNKKYFQIVNKYNKYHPPFKDDADGHPPLELFDDKKLNSIKHKIFKKKLKIIHKQK